MFIPFLSEALESDVSQYPPPSVHPAFQRKLKASPNDADISALGYLIGPTIGSLLYSLTHPTLSKGNPSPLEVMDRAFFDHIKANRASPAFQSVNNPAPDFYGEKVGFNLFPSDFQPGRKVGWAAGLVLMVDRIAVDV